MDLLKELEEHVNNSSSAPNFQDMPRRTLMDKGMAGPSGAHVIEEVHTPYNLAYISVTTGTTAFQNIVGVTKREINDRISASVKALELAGVKAGDHLLITYPPLVGVFPQEALIQYGVTWSFLQNSSRDALLLDLCTNRPAAVIGESSFLRLALESAKQFNLTELLPKNTIFIAAGTPMDEKLPHTAKALNQSEVHDLYGCQEFGWLTLDGIPLRDDITLVQTDESEYRDLLVGGLPTGDRFPVLPEGHSQNPTGKIITYARVRGGDLETTILETTAKSRETVERLSRTILRIKAKVLRVSTDVVLNSSATVLKVSNYGNPEPFITMKGPEKTMMVDSLLSAQLDYQSGQKNDPAWIKNR